MFRRAHQAASLLLLATAVVATPSSAHHSSSQFDMTRRLQVSGTVVRFQWANPHVKLFLMVPKDGKSELWAFEGNSPNVLARSGWYSNLLQAGQKITVITQPSRDGRKIGLLSSVKLANGRSISGFPVEGEGGPGGAGIGVTRAPTPPLTVYN